MAVRHVTTNDVHRFLNYGLELKYGRGGRHLKGISKASALKADWKGQMSSSYILFGNRTEQECFGLIRTSPRLGILLAAICLALMFSTVDFCSSFLPGLALTDGYVEELRLKTKGLQSPFSTNVLAGIWAWSRFAGLGFLKEHTLCPWVYIARNTL